MLDKFRKAKLSEIASLIEREKRGAMPAPLNIPRPGFAVALKAVSFSAPAVIAEYKRASPSAGVLNFEISPSEAAAAYAAAGARAISVLTEETYFKGALKYIDEVAQAGLPVLRKDFIFHPLQIDATAATKASAVLLIVRMLEGIMLAELLDRCCYHGLEAVVEVFDADDLRRAQEVGSRLIQVNNRDLDTLATDFAVSRRLIGNKRPGECWITASGIRRRGELDELTGLGFDAALVGSSLMGGANPGAGLAALLGGGKNKEKNHA